MSAVTLNRLLPVLLLTLLGLTLAGCPQPPEVTVTVTPETASVVVGEMVTLSASSTDTADTFAWTALPEAVATVDAAGVVTGNTAGTATITAIGTNSGQADTAIVTVTEPITVTVTPTSASIQVGESVTLAASSTDPLDSFTWQTADALVASVDENGMVSGVAPGQATITAVGSNSGVSNSADITVTAAVSEAVLDAFDEAVLFVNDIPDDVIPPSSQDDLVELLVVAEGQLLADQPCDAADTMGDYLRVSQAIREDLVKRAKSLPGDAKALEDVGYAEWLYAQGRGAQYDMLTQRPEGNLCPSHERIGMKDRAEAEESNSTGTTVTFSFGAPRTQALWDPEDTMYTGLLLPAVQKANSSEPGAPELPATRRLVAVPPNARIGIQTELVTAETFSANLWPAQEQPVDQREILDPTIAETEPDASVYATPPFVRNDNVYGSSTLYPESLVGITPLGRYRDMELVQVEVVGGQYNPATDRVVLYDTVKVNLSFIAEQEGFVTENIRNPFESSPEVYTNAVLNLQAVLEGPFLPPELLPRLVGEEFMIITHPDFKAAADTLAAWKNEKGIVTNVFQAGTGSGITGRETAEEIDDFIESRYSFTSVKATYILLLGDSEFMPTFLLQRMGGAVGDTIGTDWPYASRDYVGQEFPTLVPTFAVGRIPVDTAEEAQTVVDKIVRYEKNPPGSIALDDFYKDITLAAQFQCCRTDVGTVGLAQRTFTEVAEFVRAELLNNGYNVERIYEETVDGAYAGDTTPRRYYDGAPLPGDIGPGSGFAWDGDTNDVVNAFNEGRFLMLHRDHGWSGGWGNPEFNWNHVPSLLSNGSFLPVVYSINCTSGYFDNETAGGSFGTVYFTERLLRQPDGGAVGVIGDTRVSPSWPNSALTRGLFDATWPNTVPAFGANEKKRRLGDILNHAKLYILTQIGVSGAGTSYASAYNELLLYHVFGDPTMEMWTSDPTNFLLPGEFILRDPRESGLTVAYAVEGAEITVLQESPDSGAPIPVGRGTVENGEAVIEYFMQPSESMPLLLSASAEDAVAATGRLDFPRQPQK